MTSGSEKPISTNFDEDPEEGELRSSPIREEVIEVEEMAISSSSGLKGTEIHIDEDVLIDRTESIQNFVETDSLLETSLNDSKWYSNVRRSLLNGLDITSSEDDEPKSKRSKLSACFNCGGDHQILNCPVEKDPQRIRKAQIEFREKKKQSEVARLHTEDAPVRTSEFRPGRISNTLRNALGIGPDDIPEWIYRMRKLGFIRGYPPGYLRQAIEHPEREQETLKFHLADDEIPAEHGEEEKEISPPPVLNPKKMFYYMGFNNTYRRLIDREGGRFIVPPFDRFCQFHDEEIRKNYWNEREKQKKEERYRKEKNNDKDIICLAPMIEDDDIIFIDKSPTIEGPSEPNLEAADLSEVKDIPLDQTQNEPLATENEFNMSATTILGTPVSSRKNRVGESNSLPTLESFSKGITPFVANEEIAPQRNAGFMSFLKNRVKKLRDG